MTYFSYFVMLFTSSLLLIWLYNELKKRRTSFVNDINNKYILITGCGAGFGLLAAERLDKLGFRVFATCRTKAGEENVRKRCSDRVKTFTMDVTCSEDLVRTYHEIKKEIPPHQGLWGLINNAGVLHVGPIDWQSLDCFKHTVDVNLWGTVAATKTFLPLIKQARGRVVNMGSTLCRIALPHMASYTISKCGLEAFTDSLRREMSPWNIRVISIESGGHKTKLVDGKRLAEQWTGMWNELDEDIKKDYGEDCGHEGAKEMLRFDTVMSSSSDDVVNAMVTALTVQAPKLRYIVGLDAKAFQMLAMLPSSWMDWLISFGIKSMKPKKQ